MCAQPLSRVQLFGTPRTVAGPGSLVHGIFQAQILEWVALSPPGDPLHPGTEPGSVAPALTGRFFTTEPPGNPT